MLRFKILASVVPLLAAAVFARSEIVSVSHPCIAVGDTSVELTTLFWTAGIHVAFTDDPARATVRVRITDDADDADFTIVDGGLGSETDSCEAHPANRLVTIAAQPVDGGPAIYLTTDGPADYRIYVRSKSFSPREAAALIVGAHGGQRPLPLQAASL
ncbi:hypothetical protein JQ554_30205 [Bradyrhizobium diazoefficiens]|nr:hypothetical protein [Bradyrhizobium diazoefficiens]UCF55143.1 MAG: hypothetical protein JSV48_13880 [Bradyrhizobium sp.]MBR0968447.1 hypothetical protein [Bradyrhizobium diazoefficiens]MBR0981771.1 hypothetical protein [Bradyrhizobium diazoefficiens]MBR1011224.1 hypothetical protein [Bradyrhizobium diazoefficiens]MBR1017724.1 hypothetical protein [Bradyrhizobium diazoefficiens]